MLLSSTFIFLFMLKSVNYVRGAKNLFSSYRSYLPIHQTSCTLEVALSLEGFFQGAEGAELQG